MTLAGAMVSRAVVEMALQDEGEEAMPRRPHTETCTEAVCEHLMAGHQCRRGAIAREEVGSKRLQGCSDMSGHLDDAYHEAFGIAWHISE